jgi:phospholipase C
MPKDLSRIRTIAIAMMENRSFDHMLGYLSLPDSGHPNWQRIEGVRQATDFYAHTAFPVRPLTNLTIDPDPLHERENIEVQISNNPFGPMRGFTEAYKASFSPYKQGDPIERVMEYCRKQDLNTTDYLARNFAICEEWFAPLSASTLPNRLVAITAMRWSIGPPIT